MKFNSARKYVFITAQVLLLSATSGCFGGSNRTPHSEEEIRRAQEAIAREEAVKKTAEETAKKQADELLEKLKAKREEEYKNNLRALPGKIREAFADQKAFSASLWELRNTFGFMKFEDHMAHQNRPEYKRLEAALKALKNSSPDSIRKGIADYDAAMDYKPNEEEEKQLAAHDELKEEDRAAQKNYIDEVNTVFPPGKSILLRGVGDYKYLENIPADPDSESEYPQFIARTAEGKKGDRQFYGIDGFKKYIQNEDDKKLFDRAIELAKKDQEAWEKTNIFRDALPEKLQKIVRDRNFDKAGAIAKLDALRKAKEAYLTWLKSARIGPI